VDLANIAKLDAVDAANIAKVNGLTFTQAAAFLLDTYTGAQAGYSVRRLSNSATNLMRIREDAGDTETDIGYDSNNELDTAAIATHCGTANGYVVTWYDQAASNNATQGTEASQPQIYDGSAVITDNGKPALYPNGIGWFATSQSISDGFTITNVFNHNNEGTQYILASQNNVLKPAIYFSGNTLRIFAGTYADVGSADTTAQAIYSGIYDAAGSGNIVGRVNGSEIVSATATAYTPGTSVSLLSANGSAPADHTAQEIVVWSSNQRSAGNIAGIELNVNSNYLIYQPTDTPTSGLLATYSGAAAAYSVRQLADTAVMSMRVRRDSDDEEQNFGFDSNGDLDTAGIAAFCGSANGYVSRWWDQSTAGNHADQATDTSQPQIYNGSAVLTENGKPALDFIATRFMQSGNVITDENVSCIGVATAITQVQTVQALVSAQSGINVGYELIYVTPNMSWRCRTSDLDVAQSQDAQSLIFADYNGASQELAVNGANSTQSSLQTFSLTDDLMIGSRSQGAAQQPWGGTIQEVLIYNTSQSSNRTGITTNVNTYFSIY
jgi:hypothetical protein